MPELEMDPSAEVCNSSEPKCPREVHWHTDRLKLHTDSRIEYAAATDHAEGTVALYID